MKYKKNKYVLFELDIFAINSIKSLKLYKNKCSR